MTDLAALVDAEGSFATFAEVFEGVEDQTAWHLAFRSFLARVAGAVVLVDAGVGPPGGDDPFLPERQGWLPDALAREGLAPADVDLVVLTHLHVDHVGWNVRDGRPFFPNARYVAQRADYEWITSLRPDRPYVRDNVLGLELELVEGAVELLPGVAYEPLPGHTPGHAGVVFDGIRVLGDLAVHELQLERPDTAYAAEDDSAAAAATRRAALTAAAERGEPVAFSHLGIGYVEAAGDSFAWRPLD